MIGNEEVAVVKEYEYLGVIFDEKLTYKTHLEKKISKLKLYLITQLIKNLQKTCVYIIRKNLISICLLSG